MNIPELLTKINNNNNITKTSNNNNINNEKEILKERIEEMNPIKKPST